MHRVHQFAAATILGAMTMFASGAAQAGLTYGTTTFDGFNAAIDPDTGLAFVSPKIASADDYASISALCPGGTCTGALKGLTWASATQVEHFWGDIGVPLNVFGSYSSILGVNQLGGLINFLGPTNSPSNVFGTSDYLGGVTDNALVLGVPNTSYMFHFYSSVSSVFDNESAFTFGAGNGTAELVPNGGWFFYNTKVAPAPEPASLALLGVGLAALSLVSRRQRQSR